MNGSWSRPRLQYMIGLYASVSMRQLRAYYGQHKASHGGQRRDRGTGYGYQYMGWQWRNFFIPIYASCSGRHDVRQGNVNILQHLQTDCRCGAGTKAFLNLLIQFLLNHVTNLHQLTSHNTTSCPTTWRSYPDHKLLWRHFTLCYSKLVPTLLCLRN